MSEKKKRKKSQPTGNYSIYFVGALTREEYMRAREKEAKEQIRYHKLHGGEVLS